MNKMNLISFCSFRPDDDQGNPGRNIISDKKCAGAEGEELVLDYLCVYEHCLSSHGKIAVGRMPSNEG